MAQLRHPNRATYHRGVKSIGIGQLETLRTITLRPKDSADPYAQQAGTYRVYREANNTTRPGYILINTNADAMWPDLRWIRPSDYEQGGENK